MDNLHIKLSKKYPRYARWHQNPKSSSVHLSALIIAVALFGGVASLGLTSYVEALDLNVKNFTSPFSANSQTQASPKQTELANATIKVLKLAQELRAANDTDAALNSLKVAIEERKLLLIAAVKNDTKSARGAFFDEDILKGMPVEVQQLLEQKTSVEGNLVVGHQDGEGHESHFEYWVELPNKKLIKIFASDKSDLAKFSDFKLRKVKVTGTLVGDAIAADTTTSTSGRSNFANAS